MNKETNKRHTARKVAYKQTDTKIGKRQTRRDRQAGRQAHRLTNRQMIKLAVNSNRQTGKYTAKRASIDRQKVGKMCQS